MKKIDLIGQRFGMLTVIAEAEPSKQGKPQWKCRCDCGNERTVLGQNLRRGHTISCGCSKQNDLTGQRFGRLTVRARSDQRAPRGARTVPLWECLCDCGELTYKATDTLTGADNAMCERCQELYAIEKARDSAGYVGGTQLSRIRDMTPTAANTSGTRGVYFDKRTNKWRARLKFKGKLMNFGTFSKFEDAAAARKRAEEEYFGAALSQEAAE